MASEALAADRRADDAPEEPGRQRLDRWLWHARLAKSRTLAQRLVAEGRVRVNRERITSPKKLVGVADVLTLALGERVRVVRIVGISARRLPAKDVGKLYELVSEAG